MFLHYMSAGKGVEKFMENYSTNLFRDYEIARNFVSRKRIKKNFIGNGGSCNVRFFNAKLVLQNVTVMNFRSDEQRKF